jgi:hypothetical protein
MAVVVDDDVDDVGGHIRPEWSAGQQFDTVTSVDSH